MYNWTGDILDENRKNIEPDINGGKTLQRFRYGRRPSSCFTVLIASVLLGGSFESYLIGLMVREQACEIFLTFQGMCLWSSTPSRVDFFLVLQERLEFIDDQV